MFLRSSPLEILTAQPATVELHPTGQLSGASVAQMSQRSSRDVFNRLVDKVGCVE